MNGADMNVEDEAWRLKSQLEYRVRCSRLLGSPRQGEYANPSDFILRHGFYMPIRERPEGVALGTIMQCYRNAYLLAKSKPTLYTYCEGIAGPGYAEHAWCIDRDGYVVEVTWENPLDPQFPRSYWGVPFQLEYVKRVRNRWHWNVIDRQDKGWPLLRGEHKLEDALAAVSSAAATETQNKTE